MRTMEDSEAPLLVKRAQEGDRQAFEALIGECRRLLEEHVRSRIGEHLRTRVEVDDVLQEAYAQAWRSITRFRSTGEGSFLRWLRGIAEHVILKAANRARRDQVIYVEKD